VGLYISEIFFDPPGTDAPNEYVEIFSTVPNFTIPTNTFLVGLEGDIADNPGTVQDTFDLSGFVTGSNGYLALLELSQEYTAAGAVNTSGNVETNTPTVTTGTNRNGFGIGNSSGLNSGANTSVYTLQAGVTGTKNNIHQGGSRPTSPAELASDI